MKQGGEKGMGYLLHEARVCKVFLRSRVGGQFADEVGVREHLTEAERLSTIALFIRGWQYDEQLMTIMFVTHTHLAQPSLPPGPS